MHSLTNHAISCPEVSDGRNHANRESCMKEAARTFPCQNLKREDSDYEPACTFPSQT